MVAEHILLIDDEPELSEYLSEILTTSNYRVKVENDVTKVAADLEGYLAGAAVVVLDWMMPKVTGIELMRQIKRQGSFNHTPIVMLTARSAKKDIIKGIQAGAHYYINKPIEPELVLSVIKSAVSTYYRYRNLNDEIEAQALPLENFVSASFRLQTLKEGERIRKTLAALCPEPQQVALGLNELINNAIEHGNLGFSYEDKSTLLANDTFFQEVQARQEQAEYAHRWVTVECFKLENLLEFVVSDEGKGFDFKKHLGSSGAAMSELHGRGILIAESACFDELEYVEPGNVVKARIRLN